MRTGTSDLAQLSVATSGGGTAGSRHCPVQFDATGCYTRAWGGVVVEALRYWSEGPGIDPRLLGIFFRGHRTVPCALGSTQPLKMSTRIFLGVKKAGA
jgi:hypothetical protein